jgi:hypothetical protein
MDSILNNYRKMKKKFRMFDIILILAVSIMGISLYFLFSRTQKTVDVVALVSQNAGSPYWNYDIFKEGMTESDTLGNISARIIKVRKYDISPDNPSVYLTLRLQTVYSPRTKTYTYKGKKLFVGSIINLNLDQVGVDANIVSMDGDKNIYPIQQLIVKARLMGKSNSLYSETYGQYPYIADNITVGDTVLDNNGQVILTIINKQVEDADHYIITLNGELTKGKDLFLKDIYLTLKIMAYKIGSRYYFFDNVPILIGAQIPINLSKLSIQPVITDIEEIK